MDDGSIRALLQGRAELVDANLAPPTAAQFVARRVRRRRSAAGVVAAVAVVVMVVALTVALRSGRPHAAPATGPIKPVGHVDAEQLARYRWQALPAAPIVARDDAASVWTGTQLLVWGGASSQGDTSRLWADGAAYTPATRSWQMLPPAPISARSSPVSVWTGTQLIVWGGEDAKSAQLSDGASYDPATRHWTRMATAPVTHWEYNGGVALVWTGRAAVLFTVPGTDGIPWPSDILVHAYDPRSNSWTALPSAPFTTDNSCTCVSALATDKALYVWTSQLPGYQLRPSAHRWRPSPVRPLRGNCIDGAVWTGASIVLPADWESIACGGDSAVPQNKIKISGTVVDAAGRRRTLARTPTAVVFPDAQIWTGRALLTLPIGTPQAWDPRTNTWHALAPTPRSIGINGGFPAVVWTGTTLIVWGQPAGIHGDTSGVPSGVELGPPR
jgi:hypothetical protein